MDPTLESSLDLAREDEFSCAHNTYWNTYLSRFLTWVLPRSVVDENPKILDEMLEHFAHEMHDAFHNGIEVSSGENILLAHIGQKADYEWQAKSSNSLRNFNHLGVDKMMCMECWAGKAGHEFEDTSDTAKWIETVYRDRPWSAANPEPQSIIPSYMSAPERKYWKDIFHTSKHGLFRYLTASDVILLGLLGYFPDCNGTGNSIEAMLDRAFASWKLYAVAHGMSINMRGFTRKSLHFPKNISFPMHGCKGSDTMLLLRWLEWLATLHLKQPLHASHARLLEGIKLHACWQNWPHIAAR